jgi:glycosyltransferase involved in cell wall biosynthesis
MIKTPKISIYITNRNYGKYIDRAIKSVLSQTFMEYELIIVDDASDDNSLKIIKKYRNKKLCQLILNRTKKGLIKSSNIAIKAARGDYVIRLDADDYLENNALNILYDKIKNDPNMGLVYSDYFLIDEKDNLISFEKQIISKNITSIDYKPILAACCLIRKSALFSVNLYDERFNRQDGYDIWFKLIKKFKFAHVPLPLFYYRRHNINLTKNKIKLYKTRTKIISKFARQKERLTNYKVNCVIPVRGQMTDPFCNSLVKINNKPLIFYTIDEALKVKKFDKIIISTGDKKLIQTIKNKYANRLYYHCRMKKNQSYQNVSFKDAILEAIKKFDKNGVDILSILNFEYPFRKFFYIEQALSSLIVNSSDAVIGTYADSNNNYYKYSDKGIKLISNERNNKLRLEKKIVFKEAGGFSIYNYSSYLNNKTSKITNVIIDKKHSFAIFNNDDIFVANQLIKKINL